MSLPFALRALGSRNFRLFFSGQIVSLVGSWISSATNAWLVYHLTGKESLLGLSAFAAQVPAFVLAPFMGVLVDRWNTRRLLVVTQTLSLLQSATLAGLCWSRVLDGYALAWTVMALQLVQGVVNAIDLPARQSFGVQMVDRREDLPNAIALNSTMVNLSRAVGPAIAGLLLYLGGSGVRGAAWCYTVDVVSYLGVIYALLIMSPHAIQRAPKTGSFVSEFKEGLRYVAHFPALRTALLLLMSTSFFGVSFNSQLAAIAKSVLQVGPAGYGYLVAGVGIGATVSALFLATRRTTTGIPHLLTYASLMFGLSLVGMSFARTYELALLLTPMMGGAMILQSAGTNTLCQTLASDDKRGRVMSFFTMSFMGTVPLGALVVGALSERFGHQRMLLVFGAVVMLGSMTATPTLRRIGNQMKAQAKPEAAPAVAGDEPEAESVAGK